MEMAGRLLGITSPVLLNAPEPLHYCCRKGCYGIPKPHNSFINAHSRNQVEVNLPVASKHHLPKVGDEGVRIGTLLSN